MEIKLYLGHLCDVPNSSSFVPISETGNILIAGSCGSGKSIYLRTMIQALLATYQPGSVGLVLFDGKRLEFNRMKDDPHLFLPLGHSLSDFKNQLTVLQGLIGIRSESDAPILFIVDEFADVCFKDPSLRGPVEHLMEVGSKNGIYVILATQVESSYSKKMLDFAGTRIAFDLCEADSLEFMGNNMADGLATGKAIVLLKGKQPAKVEIVKN